MADLMKAIYPFNERAQEDLRQQLRGKRMMEVCEKHGPYSVACRACDQDVIAANMVYEVDLACGDGERWFYRKYYARAASPREAIAKAEAMLPSHIDVDDHSSCTAKERPDLP